MPDHDVILYDLACIKGVCFSPAVWRIRLMLNYKRVPYSTVFLEFPDIEPTLKQFGLKPAQTASGGPGKYTVPTIYHRPTDTYLMDSVAIAKFIDSQYPDPPLTLTSDLGREIEKKARGVVGTVFRSSVTPREVHILCPRSAEYFRLNQEAALGLQLESLLEGNRESQAWQAVEPDMRELGEPLLTNKDYGPFILGAQPSMTDFFIAGNLQTARVVEQGVFEKVGAFPGYRDIYEACQPWMQQQT